MGLMERNNYGVRRVRELLGLYPVTSLYFTENSIYFDKNVKALIGAYVVRKTWTGIKWRTGRPSSKIAHYEFHPERAVHSTDEPLFRLVAGRQFTSVHVPHAEIKLLSLFGRYYSKLRRHNSHGYAGAY